jgi:hypothetical protein
MAEELPKQELLIKLLKMTTSDNDGESLTALRKANEFLKTAGWDWEKLVRGRITVIADPLPEPHRTPPQQRRRLSRPHRPKTTTTTIAAPAAASSRQPVKSYLTITQSFRRLLSLLRHRSRD